MQAFAQLSESEKEGSIVSGAFDPETDEFESDAGIAKDHFFNKRIVAIRHCDVEDPQDLDPRLSNLGRQQAKRLAFCLQQMGLDLANYAGITSPFLRCLETCEVISEYLNLQFQVDPELRETPTNLDEGGSFYVQNQETRFPQFHWLHHEDWICNFETPMEFERRIKRVLQKTPKQSILITHYGFIVHMTRLATCDQKAQEMVPQIPKASITYINRQSVECLGKTCQVYEGSCPCENPCC